MTRPLRVLVAPCGFKEGLSVRELIACMSRGVRSALPGAEIIAAPMTDGGEGFARILSGLTGGRMRRLRVTGPLGRRVAAEIGMLGGGFAGEAAIGIAAAAGLRLVPAARRDPLRTTSYGVGEMIRAALDAGARRILIGCGDSGVNDAGAGLAQALGVRLLDRRGRPIGRGGAELARLHRIDLSGRDPRLAGCAISVAVNWHNRLLGPRGVARTYGPQKGASAAAVRTLERGLERFAAVAERDLGIDVRTVPGGGASGGIGAGLRTMLGARLLPRMKVIERFVDIEGLLARADLVLTAEGCIDRLTPRGKLPSEIARRARRRGVPVVALAGSVGDGASSAHRAGIGAYVSILDRPCTLEEAMERAPELVAQAAGQAVRLAVMDCRPRGRRMG